MAVDPNNCHRRTNASIAITLPSLTSSGLSAAAYSRRSSSATSSYAPCDSYHSWKGFNCRTSLSRSISNNIHHNSRNKNDNGDDDANNICSSSGKNFCTNSISNKSVLHGTLTTSGSCSGIGGRFTGLAVGDTSIALDRTTETNRVTALTPAPPPPFSIISSESSSKSDNCDNLHKTNSFSTYINVTTTGTPYIRDKITSKDYT